MIGERHYRLNENQLRALTLLYKFRYVTVPLLQEYLGLKYQTTIRNTLQTLVEQKYVESIFDVSYKIDRKPAIYYLSKKGIGLLKKDDRFNSSVLHSYYKNRSLSDSYTQHCVDSLAVFNNLRECYGSELQIFTRQEVVAFDDFPETKPDLFLRGERNFFITLAHDVQPFLIKKRLAEYIEHSEEGEWSGEVSPTLLFIFGDKNSERRFLEYAESVLEGAGIDTDEVHIGATTLRMLTTKPYIATIWSFLGNNATPTSLIEL